MADIETLYSGGVQNTDPNKSLGGFPSPVPTPDGVKNNLFSDVTPQQTTQGKIDYRCVYIFNDNLDMRYDISVYIEYLNEVGATLNLGFFLQNAVQSIKFNQTPTGGTFTLTIQGLKSSIITWDSDPDIFGANIQTALQSVTDCVVAIASSGQHYYNITFKGVLGNKSLTTMSVTDNLLTPLGTISPTVQQVTTGSPINTIAPDTNFENLAPSGVPFNSVLTPASIGTLYPSEGFPIWIKRIVTPEFEAIEGDGFILRTKVKGTFLE